MTHDQATHLINAVALSDAARLIVLDILMGNQCYVLAAPEAVTLADLLRGEGSADKEV